MYIGSHVLFCRKNLELQISLKMSCDQHVRIIIFCIILYAVYSEPYSQYHTNSHEELHRHTVHERYRGGRGIGRNYVLATGAYREDTVYEVATKSA